MATHHFQGHRRTSGDAEVSCRESGSCARLKWGSTRIKLPVAQDERGTLQTGPADE